MVKRIVIVAAVGFCVPIFWLILGFLIFNGGNGLTTDLYYLGARLLCPIFPVTSSHFEFGPPINAFVYGLVTWLVLSVRRRNNDRRAVR